MEASFPTHILKGSLRTCMEHYTKFEQALFTGRDVRPVRNELELFTSTNQSTIQRWIRGVGGTSFENQYAIAFVLMSLGYQVTSLDMCNGRSESVNFTEVSPLAVELGYLLGAGVLIADDVALELGYLSISGVVRIISGETNPEAPQFGEEKTEIVRRIISENEKKRAEFANELFTRMEGVRAKLVQWSNTPEAVAVVKVEASTDTSPSTPTTHSMQDKLRASKVHQVSEANSATSLPKGKVANRLVEVVANHLLDLSMLLPHLMGDDADTLRQKLHEATGEGLVARVSVELRRLTSETSRLF